MRYPAACSTAASSSGAGTGGATSTASPLLFPGLPQEFSSSAAVVVTKKLWIFSRAGHRIVQSTLLLSFCYSTGGMQARRLIRRIGLHSFEVEHDTL